MNKKRPFEDMNMKIFEPDFEVKTELIQNKPNSTIFVNPVKI